MDSETAHTASGALDSLSVEHSFFISFNGAVNIWDNLSNGSYSLGLPSETLQRIRQYARDTIYPFPRPT